MTQFDLYSKEIMKHFTHPKNIGIIKDADGVGTVGNPRCGDVMKVYIKVAKRPDKVKSQKSQPEADRPLDEKIKNNDEEFIKNIKVQTLGCGAAIASSSMATEMVMGKSLDEAENITNEAVAKALGGLPEKKMHCSVLARQGIQKAIENYRSKKK